MRVEAYLMFDGRTDEALAFYRKALGAEVEMLMRFKESPDQSMITPGSAEKVMHSQFRIGDTVLMASDGQCRAQSSFQGFTLALSVGDDAEAKRRFEALAEGGKVRMPLAKTFFSSSFGMVADRFGVAWMVLVRP